MAPLFTIALPNEPTGYWHQDSLYLVDSGGQYLDGTTDVTRTIAIGTPTPEMKDCFTRVLKGHIALASDIPAWYMWITTRHFGTHRIVASRP